MSVATPFAPVTTSVRRRPSATTPLRRPVRRGVRVVGASRCVGTPVAAPRGVASVSTVRLTPRGWVLVLASGVAVAAVLLAVAWWSHPATTTAAAPLAPSLRTGTVLTVQPGDTLWSIAGRLAPGRDPRPVVDVLRHANHLTSVDIVPGQRLVLG